MANNPAVLAKHLVGGLTVGELEQMGFELSDARTSFAGRGGGR